MKKLFYERIDGDNVTKIFYCPACKQYHLFTFNSKSKPSWKTGIEAKKPTIVPSIKVKDANGKIQCHINVKDGEIEYLDDCTHDWKGLTVPMQEV